MAHLQKVTSKDHIQTPLPPSATAIIVDVLRCTCQLLYSSADQSPDINQGVPSLLDDHEPLLLLAHLPPASWLAPLTFQQSAESRHLQSTESNPSPHPRPRPALLFGRLRALAEAV